MPYDIQVADALLKITLRGDVKGNEIMRMLAELARIESQAIVTPNRITDMSAVESLDFTFAAVDGFARVRAMAPLRNSIRSAFVASSDLHFGLVRMLQTLNTNPKIQIEAFRDGANAMRWLEEDVPCRSDPSSQTPRPPPEAGHA